MKRALVAVAALVLLLGATYAGLRLFRYDVRRFAGDSRDMWPGFGQDALVVVDRRATPRRGDVVVVRRRDKDANMLRRVAGLPGDTIAFVDLRPFVDGVTSTSTDVGRVYTGGKMWVVRRETLGAASYLVLDDPRQIAGPKHAETIDGYYLLADRREGDEAGDSRDFGPVAAGELRGVVRWVLDPGRVPYVDLQRPKDSETE